MYQRSVDDIIHSVKCSSCTATERPPCWICGAMRPRVSAAACNHMRDAAQPIGDGVIHPQHVAACDVDTHIRITFDVTTRLDLCTVPVRASTFENVCDYESGYIIVGGGGDRNREDSQLECIPNTAIHRI
eukprot:IDg43t1